MSTLLYHFTSSAHLARIVRSSELRPSASQPRGIKLGDKIYWSLRELKPDGHDVYRIGEPTRATSTEAG